MNDQQHEAPLPQGWERCPPASIARLGKRLRGRRTRRQFLQGMAVAASSVLAGGTLWWATNRSTEPDPSRITCEQVVSLLEGYRAKTLSPTDQGRVREHLSRCPRCQRLFEKMKDVG